MTQVKKWPKKIIPSTRDSSVIEVIPTKFDPALVPKWGEDAHFLDETVVGDIATVAEREKLPSLPTNQLIWQRIKRHGWSINPITKLPRVIGLLLKLEEEGLKGDIEAIKLYLDRVCGKQPESVAVNLTQFDGLSDAELLSQLNTADKSNIVQSPSDDSMASVSQVIDVSEA